MAVNFFRPKARMIFCAWWVGGKSVKGAEPFLVGRVNRKEKKKSPKRKRARRQKNKNKKRNGKRRNKIYYKIPRKKEEKK